MTPLPAPVHAALIIAGGRGTRLGGVDKPALEIAGRTMRARVVSAAREALGPGAPVVVVGESGVDLEGSGVLWAREDPPFSGPVAAVAAGLARYGQSTGAGEPGPTPADLTRLRDLTRILILGGDMPRLTGSLLTMLMSGGDEGEAGVGRPHVRTVADGMGHAQFLCASWPLTLLQEALETLKRPGEGHAGASLKRLYAAAGDRVEIVRPAPGTSGLDPLSVSRAVRDVDNPEELARARSEFTNDTRHAGGTG